MTQPLVLETSIPPGVVYNHHSGLFCAKKGCRAIAAWTPNILLVPRKNTPKNLDYHTEMSMALGLCDHHCETARLKNILPPDALQYVQDLLDASGRPPASRRRMAIRWSPFVP
jgi:hypothetical protein